MITLKDITFRYPGSERAAFNRVNLQFEPGEFILVCGPTGSGKSTLLKIMNGLAPHFTGGELSGSIQLNGREFSGNLPHDFASLVGFVNQQPESSFVTDTVEEELVFGMEQLGFDSTTMSDALAWIAELMELQSYLHSPLAWLSGGWQQRVAIGSALAAGQKLLLLDEPTSALDPVAAAEVIELLEKLARQHGITVVLVEHRIERVIDRVDSVVIVSPDGQVTKGGREQFRNYALVPPVIALSNKLGWNPIEVSIPLAQKRWGGMRDWRISPRSYQSQNEVALEVSGLAVRYGEVNALAKASFELHKGEIAAVMGPNGSGKSTLLWAIQGSLARSEGAVRTAFGDPAEVKPSERLCLLTLVPQRSSDLLFLNSLSEELHESDSSAVASEISTATILENLTGRLDPALHPRDLSSGQQLALVLAIQMVKGAGILLLDEPTRGLDYAAKRALATQLKLLSSRGAAILLATHDVEFAALVASRVLVLEKGRLVADDPVTKALGHRSLNPTQIAQVTQLDGVLTIDDIEVPR